MHYRYLTVAFGNNNKHCRLTCSSQNKPFWIRQNTQLSMDTGIFFFNIPLFVQFLSTIKYCSNICSRKKNSKLPHNSYLMPFALKRKIKLLSRGVLITIKLRQIKLALVLAILSYWKSWFGQTKEEPNVTGISLWAKNGGLGSLTYDDATPKTGHTAGKTQSGVKEVHCEY